jgi:hypothetical protein
VGSLLLLIPLCFPSGAGPWWSLWQEQGPWKATPTLSPKEEQRKPVNESHASLTWFLDTVALLLLLRRGWSCSHWPVQPLRYLSDIWTSSDIHQTAMIRIKVRSCIFGPRVQRMTKTQ